MASVEVGSLGVGEFNVAVAPGRQLYSGIYFVQLTRGAQQIRVRLIVVL